MKKSSWATLSGALSRHGGNGKPKQFGIALLLIACAISVAAVTLLLHVNLSTAVSLELLLVLLVALRLGFLQATVVSISAFLCLNFFFTEPVFTLTVADPQNWISLFTFEATALLVSGLSSKVRVHAGNAEVQRVRAVKLYELSRAVLLIDQRKSTGSQLSALIREIFQVDEVEIWVAAESRRILPDSPETEDNKQAHNTYLANEDKDDLLTRSSQRLLRLGASSIGGMTMRGWEVDSLTADAIASIAAIAFERTRAIQRENRAELERDAERLRTAVLDGLAHGFKTPLTAIQAASSGLLAIDQLSTTQAELVSIIDERATMLSQLTTRLLQTAALESKEIHLRRSATSMVDLLHNVLREGEEDIRARAKIIVPPNFRKDQLDAPMIELALQQLVDNAAKYSTIGSPIEITVQQTPSETAVIVQNTRSLESVIEPEEQLRIFERFYRGSDAAHGPPGTGLGLSIVKKTAEAHGGRAWVECSDDKTRFIFSIQHYEKSKNI